MALTKIGTDGIKDDAVTTDKVANAINTSIAANTAKDLTALSASNLTSGTIPDARFPATLPAASAANLTAVPAANITGTLPAISATNLTNIPAANITGTLPAISGANLTGIVSPGKARNLVINGAMLIAQRGTSSTDSGYHTVDRMNFTFSGTDESPTQEQVTVAGDTTPYSLGFTHCMKITNGNQTSGAGVTDYVQFRHSFESQDIASSGWDYQSTSGYISLSFWVRSSVAQNFYGALRTRDGTLYNYPFETGSLSANTWTKVTKTIPGKQELQFDNNNGVGFDIFLWPFRGTDYTGSSATLNQWQTWASSQAVPDMTSTWYTTNNSTFEITGLQLEVGSTATDFEHRSYGDELRKCQRYYQLRGGANGTYDAMGTGAVWSSTIAFIPYSLVVTMRAEPSFTLLGSLSDFRFTRSGSEQEPDGLTLDQVGKNMLAVRLTDSSMNANDALRLYNINTNGGFQFSAEI